MRLHKTSGRKLSAEFQYNFKRLYETLYEFWDLKDVEKYQGNQWDFIPLRRIRKDYK